MKINCRKTKAMIVKRGVGACNVSVKGEKIEHVKVMEYLGAMFNEQGSCEDEAESRIRGDVQNHWGTEQGGCGS